MVNRGRFRVLLKAVVSVSLVAYLTWRVDWEAFSIALGDVEIGLYLVSTMSGLGCVALLAAKYASLIRGSEVEYSILRMFRINLITRFYALFIPSGVGTEAVRWLKVTSGKQGRSSFFASILFERATFVAMLMGTGLLPGLLYPEGSKANEFIIRAFPLITAAILMALILILYLISPRFQHTFRSLIPSSPRWDPVKEFLAKCTVADRQGGVYTRVLLLGAIWQLFFIVRVYCLMAAMDLPLGPWEAAWMGSLVLILQILPISFAGIGVRESAFAYLFGLFDLSQDLGVLFGLLFFSQMLLYSLVGGVLELTDA